MASAKKLGVGLCVIMLLILLFSPYATCSKEDTDEDKPPEDDKWKKKDVRDYSEADLEKLFDQWEVRN